MRPASQECANVPENGSMPDELDTGGVETPRIGAMNRDGDIYSVFPPATVEH